MRSKAKILLVLILSIFTVSLVSNTYSRYIVDATGNLEIAFSKWQLLINETNITENTSSEIVLAPVLEENENIKENTIAPTSKGYFDIQVNPMNVEVSFDYIITLELLNQNIPDLLISNYSIIDSNYIEGDTLKLNSIEGNTITGSLNFNNLEENYSFEPFTIRVYFEWYDEDDNIMNDNEDTTITNTNENLQIKANIQFKQKI